MNEWSYAFHSFNLIAGTHGHIEQSRRCPLCSQDIGKYLMHHIRSKYDYQKHYLAPLRSADEPQAVAAARQHARQRAVRRREVEWGRRRQQQLEELDELERAIEKRRWVYRHEFYAMVSGTPIEDPVSLRVVSSHSTPSKEALHPFHVQVVYSFINLTITLLLL